MGAVQITTNDMKTWLAAVERSSLPNIVNNLIPTKNAAKTPVTTSKSLDQNMNYNQCRWVDHGSWIFRMIVLN